MDEVARRVDARALGVRPDRLGDVLDRCAAAAPGDEVPQELTGALVEPAARRAARRGPHARGPEDLDPDARGRSPARAAGAERHDLEHGGAPAVVERRGAEQRSAAAGQRDGHVDDVLAAGERGRDHARAPAPRARPSGRRNAAPERGTARRRARGKVEQLAQGRVRRPEHPGRRDDREPVGQPLEGPADGFVAERRGTAVLRLAGGRLGQDGRAGRCGRSSGARRM